MSDTGPPSYVFSPVAVVKLFKTCGLSERKLNSVTFDSFSSPVSVACPDFSCSVPLRDRLDVQQQLPVDASLQMKGDLKKEPKQFFAGDWMVSIHRSLPWCR